MSKKGENKNVNAAGEGSGSSSCRCEACKHKVTKFGFCQDHFEMYMAGVIRGDGTKPVDFEKKLERYNSTRKVA